MKLNEIIIGERHRKNLGDLEALANSIATIGLMHPIVVTPNKVLIAGRRRLEACRLLGWIEIPERILDIESIVRGESDENTLRKDFTPSEAVAIGRALEPLEREAAKDRQGTRTDLEPSENFSGSKALDEVASAVGMSRPTYTKAAAVVEAAEDDPETFGPIAEKMDETGKVDRAYKELQKALKEAAKAEVPEIQPDDRYSLECVAIEDATLEPESLDVIITDPPYPQEYLPLYGILAARAAAWLKPGGSLLAMVGQSYLPEVLALMVPHLTYQWTVAYLTPGATLQLWQRKVMTGWKPIVWLVKGAYKGDWIWDITKSLAPDKRFHDWGQSESGMADLIERFTYPGQTICDPFLGGGTTAVVAVAKHRRFIGMDKDPEAIATTLARLRDMPDA